MRSASLAIIDWFIPDVTSIAQSELGLARNFVVGQWISSTLLVPLVIVLHMLDPEPGPASRLIWGIILACWMMPLGLKLSGNFRLVAFISVELLCSLSLIGAFTYGGLTSPFVPWLLVSLMLGFFYLSDCGLLVLILFAGNIAATLCAAVLHPPEQHVSAVDLIGVTWLSIFSATAFMSHMAIYYSNILNMSSELERETERHRNTAQHLRAAKEVADVANAGKAIFLAKMGHKLRTPIATIVNDSGSLLGRERPGASAEAMFEIERIRAAGLRLTALVAGALDESRTPRSARPD